MDCRLSLRLVAERVVVVVTHNFFLQGVSIETPWRKKLWVTTTTTLSATSRKDKRQSMQKGLGLFKAKLDPMKLLEKHLLEDTPTEFLCNVHFILEVDLW